MCMIACQDCGTLIDTDAEPDCWVEIGNMRGLNREIALCETCRWLRADKQELEDHYASKAEADAEAIENSTIVYGA